MEKLWAGWRFGQKPGEPQLSSQQSSSTFNTLILELVRMTQVYTWYREVNWLGEG